MRMKELNDDLKFYNDEIRILTELVAKLKELLQIKYVSEDAEYSNKIREYICINEERIVNYKNEIERVQAEIETKENSLLEQTTNFMVSFSSYVKECYKVNFYVSDLIAISSCFHELNIDFQYIKIIEESSDIHQIVGLKTRLYKLYILGKEYLFEIAYNDERDFKYRISYYDEDEQERVYIEFSKSYKEINRYSLM